MQDISRYFEYIDKEEIIKKIVSLEFGKFLAYYADAPEIEAPVTEKERRKSQNGRTADTPSAQRGKGAGTKPEKGYARLFINLGKRDGFYPGELMQTLNRYVGGRQQVGHIDLLDTIAYFEVPERDAKKVMTQLTGIRYKGRTVRCNSEDDKEAAGKRTTDRPRDNRQHEKTANSQHHQGGYGKAEQTTSDWRELMRIATEDNQRGKKAERSEEGWARRKPKKKK
jgi:ATP-dependent RNA helicase DeaD